MQQKQKVFWALLLCCHLTGLGADIPLKCDLKGEKPELKMNEVEVTGGCLKASFKAYLKVGDKYVELNDGKFDSGECSTTEGSEFKLQFECGTLKFLISGDDGDSPWKMYAIKSKFQVTGEPKILKLVDGVQATEAAHAYSCESEQTIVLRAGTKDVDPVSLVLSEVIIEPYRDTLKGKDYYMPQDSCSLDASSWPKILKWMLILAIIGSVAAYFIRRRST